MKRWYVGNEIWGVSLVVDKDPGRCAIGEKVFITVISHDTENTRVFNFSIKNARTSKHVQSVVLIPEKFEMGRNRFGKMETELKVSNGKVKMNMPPGSIASLCFEIKIR